MNRCVCVNIRDQKDFVKENGVGSITLLLLFQAVVTAMKKEKSKGFAEVLVTENVVDGLNNL